MPNAAPFVDADTGDPLDLGDLIPEMKTVTVIRAGERAPLQAYVFTTAPVSVYALVAQAHDEYMAVLEDETAKGLHRDQALCRFYSQVVRHLTVGMTVEEADNLGGDYPRLERVLRALEYLKARPDDDAGEAPAVELTTEPSSPGSEPSTAAITTTG